MTEHWCAISLGICGVLPEIASRLPVQQECSFGRSVSVSFCSPKIQPIDRSGLVTSLSINSGDIVDASWSRLGECEISGAVVLWLDFSSHGAASIVFSPCSRFLPVLRASAVFSIIVTGPDVTRKAGRTDSGLVRCLLPRVFSSVVGIAVAGIASTGELVQYRVPPLPVVDFSSNIAAAACRARNCNMSSGEISGGIAARSGRPSGLSMSTDTLLSIWDNKWDLRLRILV